MLNKRAVTTVYGSGAASYDEVMAQGWRTLIDRAKVIDLLQPQEGQRFLEAGIGTGLNVEFYPHSTRFVGLDLTLAMLTEARTKYASLSLTAMDGASLAFRPSSFDGVLATLVLSASPNPVKFLQELLRVTRPGGRLAILDVCISPNMEIANIQTKLIYGYATTTGFPPPSPELPGGVIVYDPTLDLDGAIGESGWTSTYSEVLDQENPFTCRRYIAAKRERR